MYYKIEVLLLLVCLGLLKGRYALLLGESLRHRARRRKTPRPAPPARRPGTHTPHTPRDKLTYNENIWRRAQTSPRRGNGSGSGRCVCATHPLRWLGKGQLPRKRKTLARGALAREGTLQAAPSLLRPHTACNPGGARDAPAAHLGVGFRLVCASVCICVCPRVWACVCVRATVFAGGWEVSPHFQPTLHWSPRPVVGAAACQRALVCDIALARRSCLGWPRTAVVAGHHAAAAAAACRASHPPPAGRPPSKPRTAPCPANVQVLCQ
jgi:hypothetical protein